MPRPKDPRKQGSEPRSKKFVYKRASFAMEPFALTLEALLNHAWASTSDQVGKRRQSTQSDANECVVTNYRTQAHGMTFFELSAFTLGMKALAAAINFDLPTIDIDQHDIKGPAGQKLELISNMAFLGVSKNHVILLCSAHLRSPEIEAHLNWLLSRATQSLSHPQFVRLSNRVPPSKEHALKSASAIHFKTDVDMKPVSLSPSHDGGSAQKVGGMSWAGVRAMLASLGGQMFDTANSLDLSALTETTPIEVDIVLRWPKAKKGKQNEVLDKIATGLRHLDTELDFDIKTANGGKLTRSDFLLEKMKTVHCRGERPIRDLLFETMAKWLTELHEAGEIA